jgi:hypothetical protein|tara:strand:- start:404 stop:559 length:156 start_codon:yes stop_codon:yes gene_type:complete
MEATFEPVSISKKLNNEFEERYQLTKEKIKHEIINLIKETIDSKDIVKNNK